MNLNDPFGRVARKNRRGYQALRAQLQEAGVTDVQALSGVVRQSRQSMTRLVAGLLGVAAVAALIFPGLATAVSLVAAMLLIGVIASYLQVRAHLNRYRNELERHD